MQRSSTVSPPEVRAAHYGSSIEKDKTEKSPSRFPAGFRVLIGLAALVLLLAAGIFAYGAAHSGKVFRGVHVLDKDLGGMTPAEAKAVLAQASVGYPSSAIEVSSA